MRCQTGQWPTWSVDGSRVSSRWSRRHSTNELVASEPIHGQLPAKASNLQPDVFLSEHILAWRGVSQVQANQLVERPVQVDVLHIRRLVGGQRQPSEMPFQLSELRQVRQRPSSGM